jgi:hypothetical protein
MICSECGDRTPGVVFIGKHWKICTKCILRLKKGGDLNSLLPMRKEEYVGNDARQR